VFQELQKTLGRADSAETATYLKFTDSASSWGFVGVTLQRVLGLAVASHSDPGKASPRARALRPLSPRGLLPSDTVRVAHSDPWVRRLGILTISIVALTLIAL